MSVADSSDLVWGCGGIDSVGISEAPCEGVVGAMVAAVVEWMGVGPASKSSSKSTIWVPGGGPALFLALFRLRLTLFVMSSPILRLEG